MIDPEIDNATDEFARARFWIANGLGASGADDIADRR